MPAPNTVHISDGPGKFELLVSLFEGNKVPRTKVRFKISNGRISDRDTENLDVAITMVAQEDGSGDSWLFEGYTRDSPRGKVHGLYSTRSRSGWYARGASYLQMQ